MSKCGTCKHWTKTGEWETGYDFGLGRCEKIPMFWKATEWDEEGEGRKLRDQYKDIKAFTQDGSDYWAILLTLPDFGCILHDGLEKA